MRIFVLIATLLFVFGCEKEVPSHDIDIEIQRVMTELDLPSISACVVKNNSIVWANSYGYSNRETQTEATDETIYHIASISKLFIVTAIMQLEEQGKINIDTDVSTYLPITFRNPHFPDIPITARILLTHTSGLAWPQTIHEAQGIWEQFEPDQAPPPSEWVPQFLVPGGEYYNPLVWKNTEPGSFELYSNIGSNVLAYIVEQVSGTDFREYCMDHIFKTIDMQHTSYNYADLDADQIAVLYNVNNTVKPPFDDRIYASGGLKTTVQDLSRFLIAYMNGGAINGQRILQEETIQKILKMQNEISGRNLIWKASFGDWIGHTGGIDGAATVAEIHPDSKTGFIIFCNKHSSTVYHGKQIYSLVKQKANEYLSQ